MFFGSKSEMWLLSILEQSSDSMIDKIVAPEINRDGSDIQKYQNLLFVGKN